jgi:hypothetical protein
MLDYIAIGQGRLTNQFSEKPLIRGVVGAMLKPLGEVEDLADQVKSDRWIDTAVGVQLDGAGYIVGESRLGRGDDEYRNAILFKIFVNTSTATPEDLIKGLKFLTQPDDIQYIEQYPATAILYTNGYPIPQNIQSVIQDLSPAAISDVPVMVSFAWKEPFRFGKESAAGELFVNDDASYLEGNSSDIQVQVGAATTGSRFGGIAASDLFVGDFYLDVGDSTLALNASNLDSVIESGYHLVGVYQ